MCCANNSNTCKRFYYIRGVHVNKREYYYYYYSIIFLISSCTNLLSPANLRRIIAILAATSRAMRLDIASVNGSFPAESSGDATRNSRQFRHSLFDVKYFSKEV